MITLKFHYIPSTYVYMYIHHIHKPTEINTTSTTCTHSTYASSLHIIPLHIIFHHLIHTHTHTHVKTLYRRLAGALFRVTGAARRPAPAPSRASPTHRCIVLRRLLHLSSCRSTHSRAICMSGDCRRRVSNGVTVTRGGAPSAPIHMRRRGRGAASCRLGRGCRRRVRLCPRRLGGFPLSCGAR